MSQTNWITTDITISETSKTLELGKSFVLRATVLPTSAPTVTYTSSNSAVASVDKDGKVTALSAGTTTISVQSGDMIAKCVVTVNEVKVDIPVTDPSKPVDKVTAIVPTETGANIASEVSSLIADVLANKETTKVSKETLEQIKDALNKGLDITTAVSTLTVEESTIAKADVEKIKAVITEDAAIAQYLDIAVSLKAEDKVLGTVNEFTNKLNFVVAIPQNLIVKNRVFYVVRLHDGKAEKLETTLNADGTLSFATDKLSTYALVYEDAKEGIVTPPEDKPNPDGGNTPTPPSDKPDTGNTNTTITPNETRNTNQGVNTGDKTDMALYSATLLSCLVLMGIVWAVNERKKLMHK